METPLVTMMFAAICSRLVPKVVLAQLVVVLEHFRWGLLAMCACLMLLMHGDAETERQ